MLRRLRPTAPWALTLGVAVALPLFVERGAESQPRPASAAAPAPWRRVLSAAHASARTPPLLAFEPGGEGVAAWSDAGRVTLRALARGSQRVGLLDVDAAADGRSYLAMAGSTASGDHAVAELRPAARPHVTVIDHGPGPLALASYMTGDTAIATAVRGTGVLLRIRRAHERGWGPAALLARVHGDVSRLSVALDWRGDALVAFAVGARLYVRERHFWGELGPLQRLSSDGLPITAVGALVSDDGRGIVAWRTTARTLLEVSARHVRFAGLSPDTLEVDQPAVGATALRLLRLSDGRVLVAWTGSSAGGPAVRIDPVSVAGPLPGVALAGSLCDLVAGPRGDAEALWSVGTSLYAARGVDVGRGAAVFAPGERVASDTTCGRAAIAVRPTDDVPAVAWVGHARNVLAVRVRTAGPQPVGVLGSSIASSTPSSSPTRQTSSRSSSTSTHAPAE